MSCPDCNGCSSSYNPQEQYKNLASQQMSNQGNYSVRNNSYESLANQNQYGGMN
jgi:hypothetical protein